MEVQGPVARVVRRLRCEGVGHRRQLGEALGGLLRGPRRLVRQELGSVGGHLAVRHAVSNGLEATDLLIEGLTLGHVLDADLERPLRHPDQRRRHEDQPIVERSIHRFSRIRSRGDDDGPGQWHVRQR